MYQFFGMPHMINRTSKSINSILHTFELNRAVVDDHEDLKNYMFVHADELNEINGSLIIKI